MAHHLAILLLFINLPTTSITQTFFSGAETEEDVAENALDFTNRILAELNLINVVGNGILNGNCPEGANCPTNTQGNWNGNNNIGFPNGGNGNINGNCAGGNCAETQNGNFNGNSNINLRRILGNIGKNGNNNGNCKGNCRHTIIGNSNGNSNRNGINGNLNGNCQGNCDGAVAGNGDGNNRTDGQPHGNNNGNCIGNCENFEGGNETNKNNQDNCVGNCANHNERENRQLNIDQTRKLSSKLRQLINEVSIINV